MGVLNQPQPPLRMNIRSDLSRSSSTVCPVLPGRLLCRWKADDRGNWITMASNDGQRCRLRSRALLSDASASISRWLLSQNLFGDYFPTFVVPNSLFIGLYARFPGSNKVGVYVSQYDILYTIGNRSQKSTQQVDSTLKHEHSIGLRHNRFM